MTVYLLGPMSGLPDFNRPAFHSAAKVLREAGYTVINPAELDQLEGQDHLDYTQYYARDIPYLPKADLGVALPGWYGSTGARFEAYTLGVLLKRPVLLYPSLDPISTYMLPALR